jgi:hypothetical protein
MKVLSAVFQFVFGCGHRHLSRVFTIKHRTYRVCFDCGREFDLPNVLEQYGRSANRPQRGWKLYENATRSAIGV